MSEFYIYSNIHMEFEDEMVQKFYWSVSCVISKHHLTCVVLYSLNYSQISSSSQT